MLFYESLQKIKIKSGKINKVGVGIGIINTRRVHIDVDIINACYVFDMTLNKVSEISNYLTNVKKAPFLSQVEIVMKVHMDGSFRKCCKHDIVTTSRP